MEKKKQNISFFCVFFFKAVLFVKRGRHSQFPLVDGDRRVGIRPTGQLHVLTVQVPVGVEALDLHLGFICGGSRRGGGRVTQTSSLKTWAEFASIQNRRVAFCPLPVGFIPKLIRQSALIKAASHFVNNS